MYNLNVKNNLNWLPSVKVFVMVFVFLGLFLNVTPSSFNTLKAQDHSPSKAIILSACLPGAGQVYNRQGWKVPIIYAALGCMGYYTYFNYSQMKLFKDEYLYRVNNFDTPLDNELATTPTSNIYNLYENYNKTFQLSIIITAAFYGLNLIDAYVFGHLFDFQITDDLSMGILPSFTPNLSPTLNFAITLNL